MILRSVLLGLGLLVYLSTSEVRGHAGHDHGSDSGASVANPFCVGASTMNHDGFALPGEGLCNVFLFDGLVLDTTVKYAFGVIGTFCLAMTVELLRWIIQKKVKVLPVSALRSFSHGSLLFVLFCIAYALMLLIMTYQVFIFLAVVLGLTVGQLFFFRLHSHPIVTERNI